MRRGIFRIVFAGALVALLALAFAACGGDDEGSETTASSQSGGAQQKEPGSAQKEDAGQAGKGSDGKAAGEDSDGGSGGDVEPAPLKVSGGGSEQFRVKGGDNSIQTWGEESDEAQLEAAAEAVHGFFVARANEEWAAACEYLGQSLLEQLREYTPEQQVPDCADLLKSLTRHPLPASVRREATIVDAGSLRIGEDNSFLIYRGAGQTVYAMPLVEEDDAWKLTLLASTPIG